MKSPEELKGDKTMSKIERIIVNVLMSILKQLWTNMNTDKDLSRNVDFGSGFVYKIALSDQADFVLYRIMIPEDYIELMTVNDAIENYSEAVDLISRRIELDLDSRKAK